MAEKQKGATLENVETSESIVNNEVEQTEVKEVEFKAEPAEEKIEVGEVTAEPVAEEAPDVAARADAQEGRCLCEASPRQCRPI